MTKVSERERIAIDGVMGALADVGVEVHSEETAWDVLDLAAKLVSYAMKETMTVKTLRKKLAVLVKERGEAIRPGGDRSFPAEH